MKKKTSAFDVWVKEVRTFTAIVEADTLEQALDLARHMSGDELNGCPGDMVDSDIEIIGVMK